MHEQAIDNPAAQQTVEVGTWPNGVYVYRLLDASGAAVQTGRVLVWH